MLSKAITPFAQYNDREVSCTTLTIFLTIAEAGDDGVLQADLPKQLNLPSSSVSRNTCILSEKTQKQKSGMGLIKRESHPHDARINVLRLNDKGKDLYAQILNSI